MSVLRVVKPEPIVTLDKLTQLTNICSPIVVTESGITIDLKLFKL